MDAENWNKFCKVFKLDVNVTVNKKVDRSDIIQTLVNEGEFIFKQKEGYWTQMGLEKLKGTLTNAEIKTLAKVLWHPIVEYLNKPKKVPIIDTKRSEVRK